MKNVRKIGSPMTGAILSMAAAISFLFAGIELLRFGFGWFAVFPFLVGAVFGGYAVCRFKSISDKKRNGENVDDETDVPAVENGGTLWQMKKMRKGVCPFCGAALRVTNGPGMVYCSACGKKL